MVSRRHVLERPCTETETVDGVTYRCRNIMKIDRESHRGAHCDGNHVWGTPLVKSPKPPRPTDGMTFEEVRNYFYPPFVPPVVEPDPLTVAVAASTSTREALLLIQTAMTEAHDYASSGQTEDGWFYGFSDAAAILDLALEGLPMSKD